MGANTPLTTETLLTGFVSTGTVFELQAEVAAIEVAGRAYKLIRGVMKDRLFGDVDIAYAVAVWDPSMNAWRLARLTSGMDDGGTFALLNDQVEAPSFAPLSEAQDDADIALNCHEKNRIITRSVLRPYQLPIRVGEAVEGRMIAEIGVPLFQRDNASALVPVRFQGWSCAIIECRGRTASLFVSANDEAQALIMQSSAMPTIRNGVGSGVWHILVKEQERPVLIKAFYNEKSSRRDEIHR